MPQYCVNSHAQANGDHEVHNVTAGGRCLPVPANRVISASTAHARAQSLRPSRSTHAATVAPTARLAATRLNRLPPATHPTGAWN